MRSTSAFVALDLALALASSGCLATPELSFVDDDAGGGSIVTSADAAIDARSAPPAPSHADAGPASGPSAPPPHADAGGPKSCNDDPCGGDKCKPHCGDQG